MSETTTSSKTFLRGVVEGFYGRPWTMEQRKELFRREQKWGLNTYLYAPKDDYKHRTYWRELYTSEEAEQLITLISAAKEKDIEFIYAISPGLDITFSNPKEVAALKRKLSQVSEFGCRSFALLFDDIETEMCAADKEAFSSFADAQVAVTNQVFQHLQEPHAFLFCPTDYCATFCTPSVSQSSYLHTVGEKLLPGIDILWTGPKVVSKDISVESIEEVSRVLRRPPVIWDNIHANDYDPQRLFLGPFKNRPTELIPKLRGVLTNPNCEFEPNFVAVHTLGTWCKSSTGQKDVAMDGEDQGSDYNPQEALRLALSEWLIEFGMADQPDVSRAGSGRPKREPSEEEPMQTDEYVPGPKENPLYTAEPLTLEDLTLLSELFYLPYEHGPTALAMLRELHWLRGNSHAAVFGPTAPENEKTKEWRERAEHFDDMCAAVVRMFNRLSNVPNRTILYDLYNYICDIKSGVSLARAFVGSLGGHNPPPCQVINDDPEPWGFRGGLSGEFQRMLPCHGNRDLFHTPPASRVYTIRPCTPKDKSEVLRLSKEMQSETLQQAALIGDRLVDGQLSPSKYCDLVLEDEAGLCGFAFALTDAKTAMTKSQYPETMLRDFPSLMAIQIHPRVPDPSTAKHLICSVLSSLKESSSIGVFCEFRSSDKRMLDFLRTLGLLHVLKVDGLQAGLVLMGTKL
ncbi:protein O-GlcNAcase [Pygocentrus nattereri]|uniref:protein O-GlcNAcase n=1 Tax=Pygocentrus nattereri TaxID=42514 RepID=A0A3B4D199_PYGNA|nr:protein O-GlcNAcase [Pygocentrus nattereri]